MIILKPKITDWISYTTTTTTFPPTSRIVPSPISPTGLSSPFSNSANQGTNETSLNYYNDTLPKLDFEISPYIHYNNGDIFDPRSLLIISNIFYNIYSQSYRQ